MARCHQWHNIPWQALVDCLELLYYPNHPRPPRLQAKTCETEEERVQRDKKFCFFISRLEATIAEFAATERRKYDVKAILRRDKVFGDEYLNDILTPEYQSVEFWRRRQKIPPDPYDRRKETNVINELFNVNNMEAILLLVHTGIGIQDHERRSTHIHGFGFFNMAEDCLDVYVQLNYLIASGDIYLPHRWNDRWLLCVPSYCHCDCKRVLRKHLTGIQAGFTDYSGVTELLQCCFRFCYQYKMIRDEIRGMTALDSEPFDMSVRTYWQPLGFSWDVSYNPFGFRSLSDSVPNAHEANNFATNAVLVMDPLAFSGSQRFLALTTLISQDTVTTLLVLVNPLDVHSHYMFYAQCGWEARVKSYTNNRNLPKCYVHRLPIKRLRHGIHFSNGKLNSDSAAWPSSVL